jgi:hypothetical protein
MRRVQRKAWQLLANTEAEGDHRGAIVALREIRECIESLGDILSRAPAEGGAELSQCTNDELKAELKRRGETTGIVIRFGNGKDDKPATEDRGPGNLLCLL